jgi:uncharacterized alpha-E superfamily protein
MLSSTADHLYWMGRSMERAENTARMLDVTYRMSLLKQAVVEPHHEWRAMLSISGLHEDFEARYDKPSADSVMQFMALDEKNPGSIYNSIFAARENARAIRGAITSEMWEALNATWLEMSRIQAEGIAEDGVASFFEWVKERSHLSRGIAHGTLLRDDIFRFLRLGTFFERADNTARILDVKYHVLLPETERVGGSLDYFQWSTILREVSALTAYHWVYRESLKPWLVADLLILNRQMPRSLAASYENIVRFLDEIGRKYGRQGSSQRLSRSILTRLENTNIDEVFKTGLHEFIDSFIVDNNKLGAAITDQYLL